MLFLQLSSDLNGFCVIQEKTILSFQSTPYFVFGLNTNTQQGVDWKNKILFHVLISLIFITLTSLIGYNKRVGQKIYPTRSTSGQGGIFNLLHENQRVGWTFFLEKNKRACPFIRGLRVVYFATSINKSLHESNSERLSYFSDFIPKRKANTSSRGKKNTDTQNFLMVFKLKQA